MLKIFFFIILMGSPFSKSTSESSKQIINSPKKTFIMNNNNNPNLKLIIVAGGCFWGVQQYYSKVKGVTATSVGYTAGNVSNPSYKQVCTGDTGHTEAVQIQYDNQKTSLNKILKHFFNITDPTTLNSQGNDYGPQYRRDRKSVV